MNNKQNNTGAPFINFINRLGFGIREKLIVLLLAVMILPLVLVVLLAFNQVSLLGSNLRDTAIEDSQNALNAGAVEYIERMSTDTALRVADFLYGRDDDIRFLADLAATLNGDPEQIEQAFASFVNANTRRVVQSGQWVLDEEQNKWVPTDRPDTSATIGNSTNKTNEDVQFGSTFNPRPADALEYINSPLYDEVTFIGLDGIEQVRISTTNLPNSRKVNYADSFVTGQLRDVKNRANTFVRAEDYWNALGRLTDSPNNDIYVSDVIGAYVGSNFVGTYTPQNVAEAAETRGYDIDYNPEQQAYAGEENPNGQRFEGIVRWASPVYVDGVKIGYVTLALDHDHIMELVDHQTPMNERYVEIPSAAEGNYAFIWDYQSRSIAHPRHNSIYGFDPETGDPEIPWVTQEIYESLLARLGVDAATYETLTAEARFAILKEGWPSLIAAAQSGEPIYNLIKDQPTYFNQDRSQGPEDKAHTPAGDLTKLGLVGLDGRYLNNAPQCTGWLDLAGRGGSGSLYILWSGKYKLNTAAAIPYYTGRYGGQYAPDELVGKYDRVGFGFIAIGSGIEDFTAPAQEMSTTLDEVTREQLQHTTSQLGITTIVIALLVFFVAIALASWLANNIKSIIDGFTRFRKGERQFRFNTTKVDEFGELATSFDEMADALVDSVKNPLSITDMDLNIIYMNEYGLEVNGKTLDEIIGTLYSDTTIYPAGTKYCPITALANGHEAEVYHDETSGRYFKGVANILYDSKGAPAGYIISSTDVTELSLKQIELEETADAANRASQHKGEFLSRMSHEIRTPMNAIIGITSIVRKNLAGMPADSAPSEADLDSFRDNIAQIETSSQHLLSLLNDILDISKIEEGKIEITEESVDLAKLAETVCGIIRPRCDEKDIVFDVDIDKLDQHNFLSDSLRLRQVLINLLGNAVKFTPEQGHVYFGLKRIDRSAGKSHIEFTVRDTGIGISTENLETIFKPFEQGDSLITRKYGGTGLGLSISRRIVQLLGSDIIVESTPGKGSSFRFALWLDEVDSVEETDTAVADTTGKFVGKRLLLVDDVEINRMIVAAMLEDTGIEVVEADDGTTALEAFANSPEGYFDIILMDVQMPQMDGYAATTAIRELNRADAGTVPILALTANAFRDDIDRAIASGMNSHIAKPVEIDMLTSSLFRYLKIK